MIDRARELRTLLQLAGPLILGYAGSQIMSLVDAAMVGRLGASALAGVGIGNGIFFTVSCLGLGCVAGMEAPVAQALGAGETVRARRLMWQGVRVALGVSAPLLLIMLLFPPLLPVIGVDPAATVEVRAYLYARMLNVVPFLVFNAQRSYLQAAGHTRPIVVASIAGNLANFVGNSLFIYGDATLVRLHLPRLGLPALGVAGSGIASTLASAAMCATLALAVARVDAPVDPERRRYRAELVRTILRLGIPNGFQVVAEVGVFALVGVLAGRIGATSAAANTVAITLASFTFCVALGIGAATSVRVGRHIGANDSAGARSAGLVGLGASASFMSLWALVFVMLAPWLAAALTNDKAVIAVAVPLLHVAAVFQISDGLQATAAGALRGAGDPHAPLWWNIVGHWTVGLPVAIALGFWARRGATGLWWGLSLGLTVVAVALIARFVRVSGAPIRRVA
ncbi:MAG: Multi antimicrobial extrusion protein [Myxococcales bacterium]|nr:Multi antimicrobial extrusion protein [Myxococcales bacterium]